MSFLSGIGKFIGKVAKVALPVLKLGVGFIPGVGGIASKVLALGSVKKAIQIEKSVKGAANAFKGVMPGGAPITGPPPVLRLGTASIGPLMAVKHARTVHKVASYGRTTPKKRAKARKAAPKKRAKARKATGRKLKFGSPAWRKKYLKKKR